MQISDTARRILVGYVRHRLDGGRPVLSDAELGQIAGVPAGTIDAALGAVGDWCAANGLPNIAMAVVSARNAERNLMLPGGRLVDDLGGEAAARAEQARVRDFDWSHWVGA